MAALFTTNGGSHVGYWEDIAALPADERARRFRHFTPEQVQAAMAAKGLDVTCEDPATLKRAARAHARAITAAERERDTAAA